MKSIFSRVKGWIGWSITSLIVDTFLMFESTLDVRIYGLERLKELKRAGKNPLLVIWHGQGLLPLANLRQERLCLYASHTRDEHYSPFLQRIRWWTLRFIERMGYSVLDAAQFKSESRGVMQFVDLLRSGKGSVIAADGPAGPIYKAKAGPAFLAKKTGVTLLPMGSMISHGFHMDQWDRFEIPGLFAKAVLVIGEPIEIANDANEDALENARLLLESRMNGAVELAEMKLKNCPLEISDKLQSQAAQG